MRTTPAEAFAYLGDPATATTVDPAVISYEPDTVPMRPGTINRVTARLLGMPVRIVTRVVTWEEGSRMQLETVKPSRPFRALATHTFEPHPEGTIYTWSMEFTPTFPGGRFAAWLASLAMRRAIRAQQARFKDIMESRGRR